MADDKVEAKITRKGSLLSTTHLTQDELRALLLAGLFTREFWSDDDIPVDITETLAQTRTDTALDNAIRKLQSALGDGAGA